MKEEKFIQDIELMDKPNLDEIEQNAVLSYRAAKDISRHFLFYLNSCRCRNIMRRFLLSSGICSAMLKYWNGLRKWQD